MTAGVNPYKRIVFDFWKTWSMSRSFQKVAETPLKLRADPAPLRLFGTGMMFAVRCKPRVRVIARRTPRSIHTEASGRIVPQQMQRSVPEIYVVRGLPRSRVRERIYGILNEDKANKAVCCSLLRDECCYFRMRVCCSRFVRFLSAKK